MKTCLYIAWITALIFSLKQKGSNGEVIDINTTSVVEFQCRQNLTIRCYGQKNVLVNWQIAETVMPTTNVSAQCFAGLDCIVYDKTLDGRYLFNYDPNTGISDLSISHINSKDHGKEYKCNDGTSQPFRLHVNFTGKPDFDLFKNRSEPIKTTEHEILLIVETNCTTPATSDVEIIWYSTAGDGSDYKIHNSTFLNVTLCAESDCTTRNTLSAIAVQNVTDGKLRRKRAVGEGRIFGAYFKFESTFRNFTPPGSYKLIEVTSTTDTSTISTTTVTSESSFSSSSTENIKTTNSSEINKPSNPMPGNEQETHADETSTILIVAFSSIAGISLLLITGFAVNKIRKRRNLQSDATHMQEMKKHVNSNG